MQPEDSARIRTALARAPLFSSLPAPAVDDLTGRATLRKVPTQGRIGAQDEPGEAMYLVLSGRVKVVIFGENGREVTLSLLRPGDAFGEIALFDGKARSASCIAMEPTAVLVLAREDLMRHLVTYPRTALNLLGEMATRLRRADESIAQLALCDVHERLIHRLVSLAVDEGIEAPEGRLVRRRPTQQELANMIGACRETISRMFNQLAREGLIIARGRALVVTRELIERSSKPKVAA
jgi:CRP-like cAMP-binding protein